MLPLTQARELMIMTDSTEKKAKKVNYSDAQIAVLTQMYHGKETKGESNSEDFAAMRQTEELKGKSIPSLRQKLASMNLYVKPEAAKSEKKAGVSKADVVESIGKGVPSLTDADMEGLQKATRAPLDKIAAQLVTNATPVE